MQSHHHGNKIVDISRIGNIPLKQAFRLVHTFIYTNSPSFEKDLVLSEKLKESPIANQLESMHQKFYDLCERYSSCINEIYKAANGGATLFTDLKELAMKVREGSVLPDGRDYLNIIENAISNELLSSEQEETFRDQLVKIGSKLSKLIIQRNDCRLELYHELLKAEDRESFIDAVYEVYGFADDHPHLLRSIVSQYTVIQIIIRNYGAILSEEEQKFWKDRYLYSARHKDPASQAHDYTLTAYEMSYKKAIANVYDSFQRNKSRLNSHSFQEGLVPSHATSIIDIHNFFLVRKLFDALSEQLKEIGAQFVVEDFQKIARKDTEQFYTLIENRWKATFEELNTLTEYFSQRSIPLSEEQKDKFKKLFDRLYPDFISGTTRKFFHIANLDKNECFIQIPDIKIHSKTSADYFTKSFVEAKQLENYLKNLLISKMEIIRKGLLAFKDSLLKIAITSQDKKNIIHLFHLTSKIADSFLEDSQTLDSQTLIKRRTFLEKSIYDPIEQYKKEGEGYERSDVAFYEGQGRPIEYKTKIPAQPVVAMGRIQSFLRNLKSADLSKFGIDIGEEEKKEIENRAKLEYEEKYEDAKNNKAIDALLNDYLQCVNTQEIKVLMALSPHIKQKAETGISLLQSLKENSHGAETISGIMSNAQNDLALLKSLVLCQHYVFSAKEERNALINAPLQVGSVYYSTFKLEPSYPSIGEDIKKEEEAFKNALRVTDTLKNAIEILKRYRTIIVEMKVRIQKTRYELLTNKSNSNTQKEKLKPSAMQPAQSPAMVLAYQIYATLPKLNPVKEDADQNSQVKFKELNKRIAALAPDEYSKVPFGNIQEYREKINQLSEDIRKANLHFAELAAPLPPAKQKAVDLQSLMSRNNSIGSRKEFKELMEISWIEQEYEGIRKKGPSLALSSGPRKAALLNEADSKLTLLEECVDILAAIDDQNEKDVFVRALTASNVEDVPEVIKQHQSKNKDVADKGKQRSDQLSDDSYPLSRPSAEFSLFEPAPEEESSDLKFDPISSDSSEEADDFGVFMRQMARRKKRAVKFLSNAYKKLPQPLPITEDMSSYSKSKLQDLNDRIRSLPVNLDALNQMKIEDLNERKEAVRKFETEFNAINKEVNDLESLRKEVIVLRAEMGEMPLSSLMKDDGWPLSHLVKYFELEKARLIEEMKGKTVAAKEKERLLAEKATRELTAKAAEEARVLKEKEEQEAKEAKRQALIAKIAALKVAEERAKEKLAEAEKLKAEKEAVLEEAKNELVEAKKLKEEAESKEKAAQAAEQAAAETEEKAKGKEKQVDLNISAKEKEIKDLAAKAELTKAAQKAQLEERLKLVLEAKEKMDVSLAEAKANETALGKAAKIANAEALEAQAASDAANQSYQADLTVLSAELAEKQKAEVEKEEALERLQGEEKDARSTLDEIKGREKAATATFENTKTEIQRIEEKITAEEKRLEKEKREEEERAEQARRAARRQARIAAKEKKQRKQIIDSLQQAITGLTPQLQVVSGEMHATSQARLAEVTQQVQAFDQLALDGLTADEAKAKLVEVQDLSQAIKKANEEVRAVESLRAEVDQLRNQTKRPSQDYAGIATIEALKQQLERDQQTIREEEQTREDQVMGLQARRGALPSSITVTTDMPVAVQNRFAALQKQCAQEKAKSDTKLSLDEIGTASDSLDQLEKEIEDVNAEVEVVKGLLSAVKSLSDAELIPAVDTNSIEEIEELKSTLQASIQQGITTFDQEVQTLSATRTTLTTELTEIEKELDSVEKNTDEISVQYAKTLHARKQQAEESVTKIDELVTFTKGKDKPISEVVKQRSVVQPLKERVEKSAKSNQKNRKQYVEIVEKNYTRALADLSKDENYQVLEERQQALIAEREKLSKETGFYAEGAEKYIAFLDKKIPAYQTIASKVQPTPIATGTAASLSVIEMAAKQQALEAYKARMKRDIAILDAGVEQGRKLYLHFKTKKQIAINLERSQKMMDQFVYERTKAIRSRINVVNPKAQGIDIPNKEASCLKKIDAFQSEMAPLSTASRIGLSFLDLLGYPQERLKPMAMRSAAYLRARKKEMEEILKEINEINDLNPIMIEELTTDKDDRMAQPEPQPDNPGRKNKNALSVAERAQVGTTTDWGRGRADQSPQEKLQERIKVMQCEIDKKTWTTYAKLPSQQENMQKEWTTLLAEMQGVLNLIGDKREQGIILIPKTNDTGQAIKPEQKYKLISPETLRLPKHGIYTTQDKKMSQYLEELDQRIITATNNQSVAFNNIVKPY